MSCFGSLFKGFGVGANFFFLRSFFELLYQLARGELLGSLADWREISPSYPRIVCVVSNGFISAFESWTCFHCEYFVCMAMKKMLSV